MRIFFKLYVAFWLCVILVKEGSVTNARKLIKAANRPPNENDNTCRQLPNIEQIVRIGDLLLLKASTTLRKSATFYTFDWQKGQLYLKPITSKQLFGFSTGDDHPDGQILFASTFNLCSLWPSSQKRKRHVRELIVSDATQEDEDAKSYSRANGKQTVVDKLEAKLSDIQEEINEYREKTNIKEEHSEIKQQLASLERDLKLLIRSLNTKEQKIFTSTETSTKMMAETVIAQTTLHTTSTVNADIELHQQMRRLFLNLSKIASEVNAKLEELKATTTTTAKPITTRPRTLSFTSTTEQAIVGTTAASQNAQNCPSVVMATFTHSQQSWQSLVCSNSKYGHLWLMSALFKLEPREESGLPHLVPLSLDRQLLLQRNAVQLNNRPVTIRSDLACDKEHFQVNGDRYVGGFSIEDRLFAQYKVGMLVDYGNWNNPREMSIKEFLNCYGNSSVVTKPLKIIGMPQRLSKESIYIPKVKPKFDKIVDSGDSNDAYGKTGDFNDDYSEDEYKVSSPSKVSKPKTKAPQVKLVTSAVIVTFTTEATTGREISTKVDWFTVPPTHSATLPLNQSDYYRLAQQSDAAYVDNVVKDRSIDDTDGRGSPLRNVPAASGKAEEPEGWSSQNYVFSGFAVIAILGLAIFGFMCFTRVRGTVLDQEGNGSGHKKHKRKKGRKEMKNRKPEKDYSEEDEESEDKKKAHKNDERKKSARKKKPKLGDKKQSEKNDGQMNETGQTASGKKTKTGENPSAIVEKQTTVIVDDKAFGQPLNAAPNVVNHDADIDLHEVVVIDTENVLQFCGQDTQMANRIEMMFGESKVIAQLIDMKRKGCNIADVPGRQCNENQLQPEPNVQVASTIHANDCCQNGAALPTVMKIALKNCSGQEDAKQSNRAKSSANHVDELDKAPFYKIGHNSPMQSPSTSPCSKSPKLKSIVKSRDGQMELLQAVHRMRKIAKKSKRQPHNH